MARAFLPYVLAASAAALVSGGASADKPPMSHEWREIGDNHWQIVSNGEPVDVTDAAEKTRGACPPGMVEIKGAMRISQIGDELQKSVCSKWINRDFPERCALFDKGKWKALRDKLKTKEMHFCIDRYEYPNRKGENPLVYI